MATSDSFLYATDLMDHLVQNGIALKDAHVLVGKIVLYALDKGTDLSRLSLKDLRKFSPRFQVEPSRIFDSKQSLKKRKSLGSTHPAMVQRMINMWHARLYKRT